MNIDRIPRNTRAVDPSIPRLMAGGNGKAVLLLHGFNSYPIVMDYLGERLNERGYTVSIPRMPGHGTNAGDFSATKSEDWIRRSIDAYVDLKGSFAEVFVCGLSMGGILALVLASRFPIERIALAAPAIINTNSMIKLTPLLRFFISRKRSGNTEMSDDPEMRYLFGEYKMWDRPRQIAELYKLQRIGRNRLAKVGADILVIVSRDDTAVPVEAADYIELRAGSQTVKKVVLAEGGHEMTIGTERDRVAEEIISWFGGISADQPGGLARS